MTKQMIHKKIRLLVCALVTVAWSSGALSAETQKGVNGKRFTVGPFDAVRVWGTPQEMGIAHGYLLGRQFATGYDDIVLGFFGGDLEKYSRTLEASKKFIRLSPRWRAELEGILEGMVQANGGPPRSRFLKRTLGVEDLALYNSLDVIRAFGCSGFTAWGERSGNSEVITARTFDYVAYTKRVLESQFILVRDPEGRRAVATVSFPGYVGAFTGINDAGVAAFIHDGNARRSGAPNEVYAPMTLTVAEILESSDGMTAFAKAREILDKTSTPFSYMVRVVTPSGGSRSREPVHVFRIDPSGLSETKVGDGLCITTNHYVGGKYKAGDDSQRRYGAIEGALSSQVSDVHAWSAMQAVAAKWDHGGTLHALVYQPDRRRVELALATWERDFKPAPRCARAPISLDSLFEAD